MTAWHPLNKRHRWGQQLRKALSCDHIRLSTAAARGCDQRLPRLQVVARLTSLLLVSALASCSKQGEQSSTHASPAVTPRLADGVHTTHRTEDVMRVEVAAGGIPTTYQAYFSGEQLQRISEMRARSDAESAAGDYEFQGGRLLHYAGQALRNEAPLELRFDLQGKVTLASAGDGSASPEEISEIRARAQLLRSHALAQRAARSHVMTQQSRQ
jgi:hypothetical protein